PRANPGKVTIGSGGNGTATHLMAELLQENAAIKLIHVPYKGAGPAVADTVAGQIQATFTTPATAAGHLKAGRLRALGVTADRRLPDYADVPTLAEGGVKNMAIQHWWGILAPAGVATRLPRAGRRLHFRKSAVTSIAPMSRSTRGVADTHKWHSKASSWNADHCYAPRRAA